MAALHAAGFPEARAWSEAEIAKLLQAKTTLCVACPDGFALLQVLPPEAELLTIVVAPAARGQGLGASLLREAMGQAAERGVARLFLEVEAGNLPALRLYERAGFARDGIRKGYYRHRDGSRSDAILLSCSLEA